MKCSYSVGIQLRFAQSKTGTKCIELNSQNIASPSLLLHLSLCESSSNRWPMEKSATRLFSLSFILTKMCHNWIATRTHIFLYILILFQLRYFHLTSSNELSMHAFGNRSHFTNNSFLRFSFCVNKEYANVQKKRKRKKTMHNHHMHTHTHT